MEAAALGGILKEQLIQQPTKEHPSFGCSFVMQVYECNALERCVSLRPTKQWEVVFRLLDKLKFINLMNHENLSKTLKLPPDHEVYEDFQVHLR